MAERETIDEMMTRVAGEMRRRAGMAQGKRAAKWGRYAAAAARGVMPHAPTDPELMPYNRELLRALGAGIAVDADELDDDGRRKQGPARKPERQPEVRREGPPPPADDDDDDLTDDDLAAMRREWAGMTPAERAAMIAPDDDDAPDFA